MAARPGGIPIPPGVASPLSLATMVGAPNGMSRDLPQHEIQDTEAWTLVDANLNDPGLIRRRGPLTATGATGAGKTARRPLGITRTQDPSGAEQMVVYARADTPSGELYGFGNTSNLVYATAYTPLAVGPADLFCAADALLGGVLIGTATNYGVPTNQALLLWRGGSKNTATNLAVSAVARGDTTIAVTSAIASCSSGHFVFDHSTGKLVGVIKTISGSTITLENPALNSVATVIDVQAFRGLATRVAKGRITTSATSTTVNGGLTKFKAQGLGSGTWDLYTPDFTWIGLVTSVASDAQLTLNANAAVALVNADYVAIKNSDVYTGTPFGFINCSFGGHQFYADGNKVRFSSSTDREAVDLTLDGDFLTFSEDPVRALIATTGALIVVTENEAYALTGAIGTTPDRWRGEKIHDDGTICGMTCLSYKGGAIWAGKRGIWFYDGANPVNVVAKLDGDYRTALAGFSSATYRAYSAIVKGHLLVWVESAASGTFDIVKNASTTHILRPTFVINLSNGAINIWQNVEIRGGIAPADSTALGSSLLSIQTLESATNWSRVVVGETLFTDSGNDSFTCNGAAAVGPDLYVETKKYSMGDGQRLKLFRMLLLHYFAAGGNLRFDWVKGLNGTGTLSGTEFWAGTTYLNKRIKFNGKSTYLALRIYQSPYTGDPANLAAASTTRVTLGQWALGFKWKRPGRVSGSD